MGKIIIKVERDVRESSDHHAHEEYVNSTGSRETQGHDAKTLSIPGEFGKAVRAFAHHNREAWWKGQTLEDSLLEDSLKFLSERWLNIHGD